MAVTDVLIVCAGNACRSPAAQILLRDGVGDLPGVGSWCSVTSAGTEAEGGAEIDERTASALRSIGADPDGFVTRRLDAAMVRHAGLILVATRRHRSRVVRLDPSAIRRTFTLAEMARFARALGKEEDPAGGAVSWDRLAQYALDHRGVILPTYLDDDDIADPRGRSRRVHRKTVAVIADAISDLLEIVGPTPKAERSSDEGDDEATVVPFVPATSEQGEASQAVVCASR
ncbi:low molecular weight phosphatase family protein [Janibacter sp. GXQ6167]|uniref:arsenate reductase/protein-tyrosine-phosphatase family protein n=1 Tax=Janibacter sp. GXQ6167 TaxID=3240791 RepID=UPI0035244548